MGDTVSSGLMDQVLCYSKQTGFSALLANTILLLLMKTLHACERGRCKSPFPPIFHFFILLFFPESFLSFLT